jgi:hypothetical protein
MLITDVGICYVCLGINNNNLSMSSLQISLANVIIYKYKDIFTTLSSTSFVYTLVDETA